MIICSGFDMDGIPSHTTAEPESKHLLPASVLEPKLASMLYVIHTRLDTCKVSASTHCPWLQDVIAGNCTSTDVMHTSCMMALGFKSVVNLNVSADNSEQPDCGWFADEHLR